VTGGYKRLQNEELYDMYFTQNIFGVIKSRRMRLAGNVALMGERWGNLREG
jgi:hypothetical protein